MIKTGAALQIVYYLAKQNVIDEKDCDDSLKEMRRTQLEALDIVEDFIVNNFGEN